MNEPPSKKGGDDSTPGKGGNNWLRFISRAFWPAVVLLLVFTFRSEVSTLLENTSHVETPLFKADINHQARVALSIHDVLLLPRIAESRTNESATVAGPIDRKSFDRLVRLFNDLNLEHLAQKRILWVNSVVTEEDLDFANAFAALGIQVFHARNNCSAERLLSQIKYSLIITGMWRSRDDDSDTAKCARNIKLPPEDAPPEIRYAGGFQFLEYMLNNNPNHTPVVVFSGWTPPDPKFEMNKWHVAEITTLPLDAYEFALRTLSKE